MVTYFSKFKHFILGKSFDLSSHKLTNAIIEGILVRIQPNSVFVKFERHGPPPPNVQANGGKNFVWIFYAFLDVPLPPENWKSQTIQLNRIINRAQTGTSQSSWPIPESFWPEPTL